MKRKVILVSCIFLLFLLLVIRISQNEKEEVDQNMLYSKRFGNTFLKFERYDYVLGQRMMVGVEKSTDGGKNYSKITEELVIVSNESEFEFLDEFLGFIISTEYVKVRSELSGFVITQDGGRTFEHAKFYYENDRIEVITIEEFPYYEENVLKLRCSVYDNPDGEGYQNKELVFSSYDNGLTWYCEH